MHCSLIFSSESPLYDEDNSRVVVIKQIRWKWFKMYGALGIRCVINVTKSVICGHQWENIIPVSISKELQKRGRKSHHSAPQWMASFRFPYICLQGQFSVPHIILLSLLELHTTFTLRRILRRHSYLLIFSVIHEDLFISEAERPSRKAQDSISRAKRGSKQVIF